MFWSVLRHHLRVGWRAGVGHPRNRGTAFWSAIVLVVIECLGLLLRIPEDAVEFMLFFSINIIFTHTIKKTVENFFLDPHIQQVRLAPVTPRTFIAGYLSANWIITTSCLVLLASPALIWLSVNRTPWAAMGFAVLPLMSICSMSLAWLLGGELLYRLGPDKAILSVRMLMYVQIGVLAYVPVRHPQVSTALLGWWAKGDVTTVAYGLMVSTLLAALTWFCATWRGAVLLSRHIALPHYARRGGTTFKSGGFMILVRKEWRSIIRSAYIRSHVVATTVASVVTLWFVYRANTSSFLATMAIFLASKLAWDITRVLAEIEEKHVPVFHLIPIPLFRVMAAKAVAAVAAATALILLPSFWLGFVYAWSLALTVAGLGYISAIFMALIGAHGKFANLTAPNMIGDMITTGIAFMTIAMASFAADQLHAVGIGPFFVFLLLAMLMAIWASRRCRRQIMSQYTGRT